MQSPVDGGGEQLVDFVSPGGWTLCDLGAVDLAQPGVGGGHVECYLVKRDDVPEDILT